MATGLTYWYVQRKDKLVRMRITLPASLREEMAQVDENWSEIIRELIRQRLEEGGEPDTPEAMILNERVKRPLRRDGTVQK